ncbi:CotH kinase family protein [Aliiglaciecola sp. LCG003]|uniref:CotH kinase family protein n=1 Tax=Aliiglaciecola sp. LCG003 TaxID=3053655 RepID=UPI002573E426|nr:CotH kinase family protein [Aliiglaciecola sp. LCG003]WJG09952.1 CotH kinase family protein [Aliiglaciecola sp. LCG003]
MFVYSTRMVSHSFLAVNRITVATIFSLLLVACGGSGGSAEEPKSTEQPKPAPTISQFSFTKEDNPALSSDITLTTSANHVSGRVPVGVKLNEMVATVQHNGARLLVNDIVQVNGSTENDFTQVLTYNIEMEDGRQASYSVDVISFTGLPVISLNIDGEGQINSKQDYVTGTFAIDGGRGFDDFAIADMKIRGRGNSTWFIHPKKPYQMKLEDKASVLGMPDKKKWLFLAEYSDKTMLRNTIAFEMGYLSVLDWTPRSQFAEVFINNQYNGTYNITEKLEEGSNRVDLGDDGFLLEIDQLDRQGPDDVYFYTERFLVVVKEPEISPDDAEYEYISSLINQFETNLFSSDFADPIFGYAKYIDVDTFVDWYLISEITKNVDSQWYSSIYFNVKPGQKINMGPLWDFDLSFGNVDYADSQYTEGFWVKDNPWFARLFQDPVFVNKVKARFDYFKNNQNLILDKIDSYAQQLQWSQQENDDKWQTLGVYVWPNSVVHSTYQQEVDHLKSWYSARMSWLEEALDGL